MRNHHFLFFAGRIGVDTIEFDAEEARHAAVALRHTPGDPIRATDGAGTLYDCRVDSIGNGRLSAVILSSTTVKRHACPCTSLSDSRNGTPSKRSCATSQRSAWNASLRLRPATASGRGGNNGTAKRQDGCRVKWSWA